MLGEAPACRVGVHPSLSKESSFEKKNYAARDETASLLRRCCIVLRLLCRCIVVLRLLWSRCNIAIALLWRYNVAVVSLLYSLSHDENLNPTAVDTEI